MTEWDDTHCKSPDDPENPAGSRSNSGSDSCPGSGSGSGSDGGSNGREPDRIYVLTKGLSEPQDGTEASLDLIALIVSRESTGPDLLPEQAAIIRMCRSPLSVAEISAYMELPFSALKVVLADLLANGRVETRAPIPAALLPDISFVEAVMHGPQKI